MHRQWVLSAIAAAVLTGCGGGGGGSSSAAPADTSSHLAGTAAYGAPMAQASITVVDANGKSATASADAQGNYNIDITGFTAPLLITATLGSGDSVRTYHTVVGGAVAAGTIGHANVTPLTEAIAALASSNGFSPDEFLDSATLKALDPVRLQKAAQLVTAAISVVSAQLGGAGFDPVASSFSADRSSAGDKLLDAVKVSVDQNGVTLRNAWSTLQAGDTGANSITLKDLTQTAQALPAATVTDSATLLDAWVAQINQCLALAPAQRVSVDASGTPTAFLGACAQVSGFAANYKHNGYTLLQYWGHQLHDWIPGGATMQTPEVLGFVKDASGDDLAIVRLSYTSPSGGGSYFERAHKLSTGWVIDGNQRNYDVSMAVRMQRTFDNSTYPYTPYNGPDAGTNVGWFDAYAPRLTFNFNQSGPNGADVYAMRVKGPGLPASGLVFARSSTCGTSDYLGLYSNDGSVPPAPAAGSVFPLYTTGSTGYILSVAQYGTRYKGTDFYNEWRGRNADGTPTTSKTSNAAPAPGVDLSTIPELARYDFEVFKAGSNAVADTFSVRAVTRPVGPEYAAKFPWASFDATTLQYVTPSFSATAGELTTAQLAWSVPAGAPPVTYGWIFGQGYDGTGVFRRMSMDRFVAALGDTGIAVSAAAERDGNGASCGYAKLPAFGPSAGYREIGTRQVTVDGMYMQQLVQHLTRTPPAH